MITKHMGYELDIHCGGIDNLYRHHDYNRAVVEGVTGVEFAPFWLHGEHLFVDNEKMSKSKGNVVYPEDLRAAGRSGSELRFFLMYGYYRHKGNLTEETLDHAAERLQVLTERTHLLLNAPGTGAGPAELDRLIDELVPLFESEMDNDLHVARAVDNVSWLLGAVLARRSELSRQQIDRLREDLTAIDHVLQVLELAPVAEPPKTATAVG
jgi:cysteinyl-tRNA synthetase